MKSSREARILGIMLVAFMLFWLVAGNNQDEEQTDPRPSSYNATYPGLKASYLLLNQLNIPVRRLTGRFANRFSDAGLFVMAHPTTGVSEKDLDSLFQWVKAGGHLLLAGDDFAEPGGDYQGNYRLARKNQRGKPGPVAAKVATPLTRYVGALYTEAARFRLVPPDAVVEYADHSGPLLVTWRAGKGRITALADLAPLTNRYLDQGGNARLVAYLGVLAGSKPIVFDEVHHGYASEPGFWAQLGGPFRRAFWQLALAALLMAWTLSRRFGAPIIPPFEDRRTPGEYVVSLGALLKRAGAEETALREIGRAFRHDLTAWLGAPPDSPDDALLAATLERSSLPRERLERALAASATPPAAGLPPLQACRLLAAVREELNLHGRTAPPSRISS